MKFSFEKWEWVFRFLGVVALVAFVLSLLWEHTVFGFFGALPLLLFAYWGFRFKPKAEYETVSVPLWKGVMIYGLTGFFVLAIIVMALYGVYNPPPSTSEIIEKNAHTLPLPQAPAVAPKEQESTTLVITSPRAGDALSITQKALVQWTIPPDVLASFPSDFNAYVFLYAVHDGVPPVTVGINDGNDAALGTAVWDIPSQITLGQLAPGVYKITAEFSAQPKDFSRMCAERVGKDCQPNAADRAVMYRASQIKAETGWFTIK